MIEMKYATIYVSVIEEKICRIVQQKPMLGSGSVNELMHAFSSAIKDPDIRAILLAAEGEYFCAGMDPVFLRAAAEADFEKNLEESRQIIQLFGLINSMRKPVFAAVQGKAVSEGVGLAAVCDYVIASDDASFQLPDLSQGAMPALVLPYLVQRIGVGTCRRMLLEGSVIEAGEAMKMGLIEKVCRPKELHTRTLEVISDILLKNRANALGFMKEYLSKSEGMSNADAIDYAVHVNAVVQMTDDFKKSNQTAEGE
ncbi:MAG: enoyl-CoA hydratase-related protein [Ignavibacteriales bacterium]|nr:enoyl-CoA hydratase-related protein [Ignavibacteriales bacterium]